jgi:hypothetical protein
MSHDRSDRSVGAAVLLAMCALLLSICSGAFADQSTAAGKDKLTGMVSGVAIHPMFGPLPFTDSTDGQSDGVNPKGGGTISFDFSHLGVRCCHITVQIHLSDRTR